MRGSHKNCTILSKVTDIPNGSSYATNLILANHYGAARKKDGLTRKQPTICSQMPKHQYSLILQIGVSRYLLGPEMKPTGEVMC